ncbi:MAG: hypothetical protein FWC50_02765 [Planctomycetaceae bacterium]|nr:hypothetical protein [Planctomycetaceae bacterium]
MKNVIFDDEIYQKIHEILGYLNFSAGTRDSGFLRAINQLYKFLSEKKSQETWRLLFSVLRTELDKLSRESDAFRSSEQAKNCLNFVLEKFLPAYREFHSDTLLHQSDDFLYTPFFLGCCFEVLLSQETPWSDEKKVVSQVIHQLNDYIGYRPVPVLEGREKNEPNPHEWVAALPLYIEGAGVAEGRYRPVIEKGLEILRGTNPDILRDACFDPEKLRELSLDPRAYDFDHPVNRRPNYHFGTWDPHTIDNNGYYRRFVVHQVTLDGIMQRLETAYTGESEVSDVPYDELLYEAGAVLAGTMLMGAGISGDHTHTYDSNTSLTTLMPHIAGYRDRFYEFLIAHVDKKMRPRLDREMARLQQPFGGARQALNKQLAKRRADQLQRFHLARTLARMGYFDAAKRQADIISVVSARILCKIDCLITEGHLFAERDQLGEAAKVLPQIEELIRRGIDCGALVDPWTILGFGAQYSLFPAIDNTVHDHRVDDLINLLNDIFDLYSRLQKEAAAAGQSELQLSLSDRMSDLAGWWDQYGSTEVSSVEGFSGQAVWASAAVVATALAAWNQAGTAAGDISFWSRHVERFESPKAYVLLGEALLDQRDLVASMALMMHWLSQAEEIPLTEGDFSFHTLIIRWIELLWKDESGENGEHLTQVKRKRFSPVPPEKRWELTIKLFDYLEANADKYWAVPKLELDETDPFTGVTPGPNGDHPAFDSFGDAFQDGFESNGFDGGPFDDGELSDEEYKALENEIKRQMAEEEQDEKERDLFSAAYEHVTYHDTTDDGIDDDVADGKSSPFQNDDDDFGLLKETDRISERLAFLLSLSKLWRYAASKFPDLSESKNSENERALQVAEKLQEWLKQANHLWNGLQDLLRQVTGYEVPPPKGTQESLIEYDRHRGTKEILIDRIVWTTVELIDAFYTMCAVTADKSFVGRLNHWQQKTLPVFSAFYRADIKTVKKLWPKMLDALQNETLLYIPTARGGSPQAIVSVRFLQQMIIRLFEYAPRLGLITETVELLHVVERMEQLHPLRQGAITEYDRLFEKATRCIASCIAESSKKWRIREGDDNFPTAGHALVEYIERIIEILLAGWLSHSRQIRISPVESIADRRVWDGMKAFIQKYGHDIFTQHFMGFGHLRAVLHQGTENYLKSLMKIHEEDGELETAQTLVADLIEKRISMEEAVFNIEVIFESIAENYSEYIDYNSTTIHSDRGEKLYMLLDMLRVLTGYERISWNLKPVYWVHDEMIRSDRSEAAELWERAVAKRSVQAAEEHLKHYMRLSEKYGMWLPSVHERLQERFIRPLQIDRMCGLVPQAVKQAREEGPKPAFTELEEQIELFAREPMGVGYEIPEWLSALQDEVMATHVDDDAEPNSNDVKTTDDAYNLPPSIPQIRLSRSELDRQLLLCAKNSGII